MLLEFKGVIAPLYLNPSAVSLISPNLSDDGGCLVFVSGGRGDHFYINEPIAAVVERINAALAAPVIHRVSPVETVPKKAVYAFQAALENWENGYEEASDAHDDYDNLAYRTAAWNGYDLAQSDAKGLFEKHFGAFVEAQTPGAVNAEGQ